MPSSRILELAAIISTSTTTIYDILAAKNHPLPSFDADAPGSFPEELDAMRNAVIDATSELHDLLLAPEDLIRKHVRHANIVSLHAIQRFDIASSFAPGDQVSFAYVADKCGQPEANIRRMLRHAMTMRVFREPEKGVVAHTAASRLLRNRHMADWLGATCEDSGPAALRAVDAMCKWPRSQEPHHSVLFPTNIQPTGKNPKNSRLTVRQHCKGMALANNTTDNMYQIFARSPARAGRFSSAMVAWSTGKGFEMRHLLDNYDWTGIGSGLVVDVGGAQGHISIELARLLSSPTFVVQDLDDVVQKGVSALPLELEGRVRFMAHDFFTTQPVRADLYYFRWIFHNWSDDYCLRILRALIPALRPGVKVLIHDVCMPEPGTVPHWKAQLLGSLDIGMLGMLNARERYLDEWQSLLRKADTRFKFLGAKTPPGSNLALIEACWEGE